MLSLLCLILLPASLATHFLLQLGTYTNCTKAYVSMSGTDTDLTPYEGILTSIIGKDYNYGLYLQKENFSFQFNVENDTLTVYIYPEPSYGDNSNTQPSAWIKFPGTSDLCIYDNDFLLNQNQTQTTRYAYLYTSSDSSSSSSYSSSSPSSPLSALSSSVSSWKHGFFPPHESFSPSSVSSYPSIWEINLYAGSTKCSGPSIFQFKGALGELTTYRGPAFALTFPTPIPHRWQLNMYDGWQYYVYEPNVNVPKYIELLFYPPWTPNIFQYQSTGYLLFDGYATGCYPTGLQFWNGEKWISDLYFMYQEVSERKKAN